jgi:hypothetical protein
MMILQSQSWPQQQTMIRMLLVTSCIIGPIFGGKSVDGIWYSFFSSAASSSCLRRCAEGLLENNKYS